jgi:hypothetical protein
MAANRAKAMCKRIGFMNLLLGDTAGTITAKPIGVGLPPVLHDDTRLFYAQS